MKGAAVPEACKAALPFDYKITGGSDLKVRVMVDQKSDFIRANNVIEHSWGSKYPDEWIILGSHL